MPKSHAIGTALLAVLCGFIVLQIPLLPAQTASGASSPNDPKALLLAAAAANGAPGADAKPWHAKISFTLNGWSGKAESEGTIEEFWVAPDKIKLVYATSTFNQVEYTTPAGIKRTGSRDSAPWKLIPILDKFLHPIPSDPTIIASSKVEMHSVKLGNANLSCILITRTDLPIKHAPSDGYCLDEATSALRMTITAAGTRRTTRNRIARFQNRYLPQEITEYVDSPGATPKTMFTGSLEKLEELAPADAAQLTPPADAVSPPKIVELDEKTTKPQLALHPAPVYPPIAQAAHVSGPVVSKIHIQTDGTISFVGVLSGPPMLHQAAIDAIYKWTYKQFEQNGEPVEVNTTITIKFTCPEFPSQCSAAP
jgi:TonB family protein